MASDKALELIERFIADYLIGPDERDAKEEWAAAIDRFAAEAVREERRASLHEIAKAVMEEREACASLKISGEELVELSPSLRNIPNLRDTMISIVDAAIEAYRDAIRARSEEESNDD